MQRHARLLSAACLALICCASAATHIATAQESAVLAQDLKKLRAPGKISAVLWTRRSDSCTLQVVLPRPSPVAVRVRQSPQQNPQAQSQEYPKIQVWLLRSDGTIISWTRRYETPTSAKTCIRCIASEVNYSFPLSASRDAVAAAISVDDDFYIEPLEPFGDEKR